jgi:hypothetical protein
MKAVLPKIVFWPALFLVSPASTLAERGDSIMFESKQHTFTTPPPKEKSQAEKCQQLLKEIEALKGKPQRRHAVIERHKLMCLQ